MHVELLQKQLLIVTPLGKPSKSTTRIAPRGGVRLSAGSCSDVPHGAPCVHEPPDCGQSGQRPVQVRNHDDAGVRNTPGAFMRSDLPIAGFAVIEADSAEEAAELVSATPCAVAHGVVEVWPLQTAP